MTFIKRLKRFGLQIFSVIAGAVFIAIWVIVQWSIEVYIIQKYAFELNGLDQFVLLVIQGVFFILTLVPTVYYAVIELLAMYFETRVQIHDLRLEMQHRLREMEKK